MKKKYTDEDLQREMRNVYEKNNNRVPTHKEWPTLSNIDVSTVANRFGTWRKAWDGIGLSIKKQNEKDAKRILLKDFIEAYKRFPDVASNYELLKLSGHRVGIVHKYFISLERFLETAKVDARCRVSKKDVLDDYLLLYNKVGRVPNKKDIKLYGKYSRFVYKRKFGSFENLHKQAGIEENIHAITDEELIEDLIRVENKIGRVPTTDDIVVHGKFSRSTYNRHLGGNFTKALKRAGMTPSNIKTNVTCPYCQKTILSLVAHMKQDHEKEYKTEEEKIVRLYLNGMSNMKIVLCDDVVFNSSSSISKIVRKHTTKEERAKLRLQKISRSTKENYKNGKMNRARKINVERSQDEQYRENMSESLKQSYKSGNKTRWSKGLTKESSEIIRASAEKTSKTMKHIYKTGQIERSNSASISRYRLGAGFTKSDRKNIKKRANYMCERCFITQEDLEDVGKFLECDHIIPIYKGGSDDWSSNGQALCPDCHLKKTMNIVENISYVDCISTPITCNINEILEYRGKKLTKKYVSSVSYKDRCRMVRYLLDFFIHYDFSSAKYSLDIVDREIERLKASNKTIERDKETYLTAQDNNAIVVCKHFFPHISEIRAGKHKSILESLTDKDILLQVIKNRLGGIGYDNFEEYFNISPATIILGAKNSMISSRASIFKPVTAKIIYDHWTKDGDIVYDYSAGFGGRLLGAYASRNRIKYIGTDPNTKTYGGLNNLCEYLNYDAEIYNHCSEDYVPENIDFAFSSPPYFDHEIYCDEKTQSISKFPRYSDWLEGYWRKTVRNINKGLKHKGVFAINIGNTSNDKMQRLYDDATNIIEQEGLVLIDKWHMKSNSIKANVKLEPINFYQKK